MPKLRDDRHTKILKQQVYAKAIMDSAINAGGFDEALKVRSDFVVIANAALSNYGVADIFEKEIDEYYKETRKNIDPKQFISSTFKGASKSLLDVLVILAENRDLYLLGSMFNVYNNLLEEKFNAVIVDIFTSVELDDNLRDLLKQKLQNDLDSNVYLNEHVDKDILGGIVIKAKNRIIDCSMLSVLENAKNQLTAVHDIS